MGPATAALQEIPDFTLAMAALIAVAALLAVLTQRLRLPLTLLLVLVGFAAGEIFRQAGVELPLEGETFHDVVIFVFLPILVFEAALSLPARVFARNLVPILLLAVVALVIAAGLVAALVHWALGVPVAAALLFGALISATDPVAVTQTFRRLGVPKRLLVLVEGESLLNDGIAIVLFEILLLAALGTQVGVLDGATDFLVVFAGGAALGALLALGVAEIASRLGALPSTALTIALAYGAYALAEVALGFSGVVASATAGLVLASLSGTLIPRYEVRSWHTVWASLAFVANGLLFLIIGLVIDSGLILDNLDAIAIAVVAVAVSRPLAVFSVMPLVGRLLRLPAVGVRNQMVLVWGGLRGGVALALALAIPETLAEQETLVAMTAGVVLATLMLNATTIGPLVHRLGLDRPSALERFVAAAARFDGARTARERLRETVGGTDVEQQLLEVESAARDEISRLDLPESELELALVRRGIAVERVAFAQMIDEGVVPQWHARLALNSLDDQLEALAVGRIPERHLFEARGLERLVYPVARLIHMGRITPARFADVAFRDYASRARAAGEAVRALESFAACPGVDPGVLEAARGRFERWRDKAVAAMEELERRCDPELIRRARRQYASDMGRVAATHELEQLAREGLVSDAAVEQASLAVTRHLERSERQHLELEVDPDEDLGS